MLTKVPKRLPKSMTFMQQPKYLWRAFQAFCHHTVKVDAVADYLIVLFLSKDEPERFQLSKDPPTPRLSSHPDFYQQNIGRLCEQLGGFMKVVQVSGDDPDHLLQSPEVAKLLAAAELLDGGRLAEESTLAHRLTPRYHHGCYTAEPHGKAFWQHGLVRRVLHGVREGCGLGLEAAACQLGVTPDMLASDLGRDRPGGVTADLTQQQYVDHQFGSEEQFWSGAHGGGAALSYVGLFS